MQAVIEKNRAFKKFILCTNIAKYSALEQTGQVIDIKGIDVVFNKFVVNTPMLITVEACLGWWTNRCTLFFFILYYSHIIHINTRLN